MRKAVEWWHRGSVWSASAQGRARTGADFDRPAGGISVIEHGTPALEAARHREDALPLGGSIDSPTAGQRASGTRIAQSQWTYRICDGATWEILAKGASDEEEGVP